MGIKADQRRQKRMLRRVTKYNKKRAKYVSKKHGDAGVYDKRHKRQTGRLARKIKKHGIKVINP